jgi:hypothetical protein
MSKSGILQIGSEANQEDVGAEKCTSTFWVSLLRETVIALLISSLDTPCCARWRRSSGVPALASHLFCKSFPPKFRTLTTSLPLCFPLSSAVNLLSLLAEAGARAGRVVLLGKVLLLSSVTSCTSWMLCSARMADVEGPSDFSFNFVLKSSSPLLGNCSALRLAVPSFIRLAGIPSASQRILIVFSGSEPNAATRAGPIVAQAGHARLKVVERVPVLQGHPVWHLHKHQRLHHDECSSHVMQHVLIQLQCVPQKIHHPFGVDG